MLLKLLQFTTVLSHLLCVFSATTAPTKVPTLVPTRLPSFSPTITMGPTTTLPSYLINSIVSNGVFQNTDVKVDPFNNIYYSDSTNMQILMVNQSSLTKTPIRICGSTAGSSGDNGKALNAKIDGPKYMHVDANKLYFVDQNNVVVRAITFSSKNISLVAGSYVQSIAPTGNGGLATSAKLNLPMAVWADTASNVYITDNGANMVMRVDASTKIITFVITSGLSSPYGIWGDSNNQYLYVANQLLSEIRRYDMTAAYGASAFAGKSGTNGATGDGGSATSATLNKPRGVWGDVYGNVYIADTNNRVIRRVTPGSNFINRISGTYGTAGSTGDGGPALSATDNTPLGVGGNNNQVFIAETSTVRVLYTATAAPSRKPTATPTFLPTLFPTRVPTGQPSFLPTASPSMRCMTPTNVTTKVHTSVVKSVRTWLL